ncbi:MAG: MBOAT family protein [Oscillospiraceae bacterium]|jgi:alginate O-acetyltransferase complex protein AlgI|nr:MBOAT family protein [Oscillospiraceae bacterium]
MLFSSLPFLVLFLPAVLLLHLAAPRPIKNAVLLLASVLFYAWGEAAYAPLMLVSLVLNYAFGLACASPRRWVRGVGVGLSLAVNLGALAYFKYADFFLRAVGLAALAPRVALPLGISFYTFQIQAYVVDVRRGTVPAERNFVDYAAFALLFPQLIAGPIVLYGDVRAEIKRRGVAPADMERGMALFVAGLASKVLLANPLGGLWSAAGGGASSAALWLGIVAFGLQIYFDFAGYSLMALGMGAMLGFRFPQNFNHPYAAISVRDFWRRWHMTLSGWFRDYLYIPLGGSRGGALRTLRNLFIVWALTGLWHGAGWNFVAWGLWYFVFLALERFVWGARLARLPWLGRAYTLLVVLLGWVLFAHDSLGQAVIYLGGMFALRPGMDWVFPLRGGAVLLAVSALCCAPPVVRGAYNWLGRHAALRAAVMTGLLLLCVASLVNADYNPFLYFRF